MRNENHNEDPPLLEGLGQLPDGAFDFPAFPAHLKEELLQRTSRVVRGRLVRRRLVRATAVLLIYVGGAGTGYLLWSGPGEALEAPGSPETKIATAPAAPGYENAGSSTDDLPSDPRGLEEGLVDAQPEVRRRIWKRAGDGYLSSGRSDPEAALYCYQRLMADARTSEPEPGDSWLLKALKVSRE